MKKLLFLMIFGALVSGLHAQSVFAGYETSKTTGVAVHTFSASATVINLSSDYDQLELRWIGKTGLCASNDYLSFTSSTRTNNFEIGFDFPFAEKTMKYFGLTAGGMLFFGESDVLEPAVDFSTQTNTSATDYVYFIPAAVKSKFLTSYTLAYKSLTAGTGACVRYEKVQDTVFIAYENLQMEDVLGNVLTLSFQYAFDKSGKLSFRPVSMNPTEPAVTTTGADQGAYWWACSLGLVSKNQGSNNLLFIQPNGTKHTARTYMEITQASHPAVGESYNFVSGSNECVAVASPQVNWDYDVMGTSLVLNPSNAMTWNAEAPSTLFVLSTENPLTGENLPQNGTLYPNGGTVGSSAFVTTGTYNKAYKRNYFQRDKVDNLEGSVTFYLYAFPYNNENCGGGPLYNTTDIPFQSFRTNYKAPASLRVKSVTSTSAELQVAVDAKATRYMLAFDTLQLDPQADMKVDETKKYAAGDKITIGNRQLTVLEPCASNPEYTWTGLKKGRDYYCYAWSVNPERDWYSRGAAQCGVAPVRTLPATLNFNAAAAVNLKLESGNLPAGWEEVSNNTYEYVVREVLNRKVLSVQSTGYGVADPSDPSKVAIMLSQSAIVSPYINRGESENGVKATIEFVFWGLDGNTVIASLPKSTDKVFVECEDENGQWSEIGTVKSSASVSGGVHTLVIPSFMPKEIFRLRFRLESTTELPDETSHTVYFAGISNIRIESLSPEDPDEPVCEAVKYLQVEDGSLTPDGVTLKWYDENNDPAPLEYSVLYKEESEEEWNVYPTTRTNASLTGLQAGSSYTAMVRTYCTYEDSSELSTPVTFTIPSCGAPTSVLASNLQATSVDLSWEGSGLSYAVVYAPRVGNTDSVILYTEQKTLPLTELTPNTPYKAYVISYCGAENTVPSDPSATVYFNTPEACTAPELELVEGSVTWQSAWFTIKSPAIDRQIRIFAKDSLLCPVEYGYVSQKDTLKPNGFIDCENTTYVIMARSLCTTDTSEWSEGVEFTTLPVPECGAPSNLQAWVEADGRSATVSWTAGENNKSWLLMHKEKSAQRYDTLPVSKPFSAFYGLKANTVYTWRIQANCDRYLYSNLVYGEDFSTATEVSLSSALFADKLRMRVDANRIEIENADGVYIKTLEVISMDGKRLRTYTINSSDNVLIPHTLPLGPAVFRITGKGGQTAVYKWIIK